MDFFTINNRRRTVRYFKQIKVKKTAIKKMLDAARKSSSAGNLQPLRYIVVTRRDLVNKIFAHTAWAALVKPMRNPEIGKSAPLTFIAVIAPAHEEYILHADAGAAIQVMQLAATAQGLGCCWLGAFNHAEVNRLLELPKSANALYLVAVGVPDEKPVIEDIADGATTKYYLDNNNRLHVPKHPLDSIVEWR